MDSLIDKAPKPIDFSSFDLESVQTLPVKNDNFDWIVFCKEKLEPLEKLWNNPLVIEKDKWADSDEGEVIKVEQPTESAKARKLKQMSKILALILKNKKSAKPEST